MFKKYFKFLLIVFVALSPLFVLAQDPGNTGGSGGILWGDDGASSGGGSSFSQVLGKITTEILQPLVALIFGLALIYFLWGVLEYLKGGDPKKVSDAVNMITYGIIAMFVMLSVWGLVGVLVGTFNFGTSQPNLPQV